MGFRIKDANRVKNIVISEFGIGSCVVNGTKGGTLLLTTDDTRTKLFATCLITFTTVSLSTVVEDVYHLTTDEARAVSNEVNELFNEVNELFNEHNTFTDYGWNSKGIKGVKVAYEDN